ncbi:hypothetical protein V6N13_029523 [Hibiscus sabdariffa]
MDSRVLRGRGMRHMPYAPSSEHCTIVFHHGGFIVNHPKVAYTGKNISFFDMCHMDSMSMLEVDDMVKELGYNRLVEMYWQEPCGVLKLTPVKIDYDVLSMLGGMPRSKYVHVYLQEIVEELMDECNVWNVGISEKVGNAETIGTDLIDRDVEIDRTDFSETVRNAETVRTFFFSESEDEDANYVTSESEHSGSPFKDSDNDIVDDNDVEEDDEVCDVPVGVGRDIPKFTVASNEGIDEETYSEAEIESLHSASDSEREGERRRFPEFNSGVDIENPQFKKGLLFPDQKVIKTAVKQYAVKNKYNLRLKVSDSARLQVVCMDGCPWMIWASRLNPKDSNDNTWQIKTFVGEHKCNKDTKNRNCTSKWLAREYIEKFIVEPNYSAKSLKQDVMRDHILQVPRPLICLDGCFLKGHYQGWLLAAVGIDANDCIYPLAYAAVECENRESWSWFLRLLETDLELRNLFHYTFMSDKQKGVVEFVLEIFPNGEYRTCVRHLYSNFKSKPKNQGKALKDYLWKASIATYMKEWTDAMNEMKAMSEPSFNWLQPKDPR